jgi:hypothetical protein
MILQNVVEGVVIYLKYSRTKIRGGTWMVRERKEEPLIIDMQLMVKYVTLQAYYKELWKEYVDVVKENNELRDELVMQKRLEYLPRFVD